MDIIEIFGLVAGFCTTSALFPQALKVWKTRSAEDLSLGMYSLFCAGLIFWIVYGTMISSLPVILANVVSFVFAAWTLAMKLKFDRG
ncbi:MAG: SemiSWEET family sugar transporter [Alphaproteobacteria bacterium]